MKEFKSINEQLEILRNRGLNVEDSDGLTLLRENYYSLINGYKDPFLDKVAMESSSTDIYKEKTSLGWIYSLFKFDRELRQLLFKYLILAEAYFKTASVYAFCKAHRKIDEYLNENAYCKPNELLVLKNYSGDKESLYRHNIDRLMRLFNKKIAKGKTKKAFINHYLKKGEPVPLWVLANDLTFGNILNFYQLLRPSERNAVSKYLYICSEKQDKRRFSPQNILRGYGLLLYFRNICAHDERLYCASKANDTFADMLDFIKLFLPSEVTKNIDKEIRLLTRKYCSRIHVISRKQMNSLLGV